MSKLKLLIVDDEPGIRSGVERVLRNYTVGYPFMDEFEYIDAQIHNSAVERLRSEYFRQKAEREKGR